MLESSWDGWSTSGISAPEKLSTYEYDVPSSSAMRTDFGAGTWIVEHAGFSGKKCTSARASVSHGVFNLSTTGF